MKVLVVGSTGFVGSNLNIEEEGIEFHGIDLDGRAERLNSNYSSFKKIDFLSRECIDYIKHLQPDYVVLLAGIQFTLPIQKRQNRKASFEKNIEIATQASITLNQIPSIKKLIYVSTDMVYGIQHSLTVSEENQPFPIGEYGQSKLDSENILREHESRVVILRPRLIVGPGRVGTIKLLSRFVNKNLPIPLIGNGENRYQMLSVFDLWSAIEKSMKIGIVGVFNLGSDEPPTLNELFPRVLSELGRNNRIIRLPQAITEKVLLFLDAYNLSPLAPEQFLIAGQNCSLSTNKFKAQTGWKPEFSDKKIITDALRNLN
jgi:dTDP-glucose 4,6-dehydratase